MVEIGQKCHYAKGADGKGYDVVVQEIRTSIAGEKIPYVERVSDVKNEQVKFTCPMEDLTPVT